MFVGRIKEKEIIESSFKSKKSELITIYGRRRIGKSFLIEEITKSKKTILVEGLEKQSTQDQIEHFLKELSKATQKPLISKLKLTSWSEIFELLTEILEENSKSKTKTLVVLDEFQWMACGQTKLVSIIKNYWDTKWKNLNVLFILCGSIAHYMVKKVIQSKALYGRINHEINLQGLNPNESRKLLKNRGDFEVLKYLLVFGGVPKYLDLIDQKASFEKNINKLCLQKDSYFISEPDKIFFSQFKEAQNYKKIIELLNKGNFSLEEISEKIKIPSGGGLKSYLDNLEKASFVRSYVSINQKGVKGRKYKLFDEFLIFYYKFIKPNLLFAKQNETERLFENVIEPVWSPWLGIAFENFCIKNAMYIAKIAKFSDEVINYGPLFSIKDHQFQIDLIYKKKSNSYVVCEMKFYNKPIGTTIIPEVEKKLMKFKAKLSGYETVEKYLIAPFGADQSLKDAEYFDKIITLKELL